MVEVIDRVGRPLPAPLEVQHERAKAPDMTGGHQVVVCSREQLKVSDSDWQLVIDSYWVTASEWQLVTDS